jgi:hypothetical protein
MKTAVSALMVLAFIVLLASIVLQLGSYTGSMTTKETALFDDEAVSSNGAPTGTKAAWAQHRKDRPVSVRTRVRVYK